MLLEKSESGLAFLVCIHNTFSAFNLSSAILPLSEASSTGVSNEELPKMHKILDRVVNSGFVKYFGPNSQLV